jgi:hypothetical protein
VPTKEWTIPGTEKIGTLNEIIADEIVVNHLTPKFKRQGKVLGELNPMNIINEDGLKFMIITDNFDTGDDTHELLMQEFDGALTALDTGNFLELEQDGYILYEDGKKIKLEE